MRQEVYKTYKGCVEITNHVAEKCIKNQEDLIIEFEGKEMRVKLHELLTKRKWVSREFGTDSKKPYRLWAYTWIPDEILKEQ